jgi:hypothetical protein
MRYFKHFALMIVIIGCANGYQFHQTSVASAFSNHFLLSLPNGDATDDTKDGREATSLLPGLATQRCSVVDSTAVWR